MNQRNARHSNAFALRSRTWRDRIQGVTIFILIALAVIIGGTGDAWLFEQREQDNKAISAKAESSATGGVSLP